MIDRNQLKAARIAKGITQVELARRMGVTAQTISQYERGCANPKLETVKRFAEALDVSVAELYGQGGLIEPWSNAACMGYCLMAMRQAGVPTQMQREVLACLEEKFDFYSLEDAERAGQMNTEG